MITDLSAVLLVEGLLPHDSQDQGVRALGRCVPARAPPALHNLNRANQWRQKMRRFATLVEGPRVRRYRVAHHLQHGVDVV